MGEQVIFDLISKGGPAAMAALCFFLYLRESKKRDDAVNKVEKLTERCIEALVKVDNALEANVSATEGIKTTIQSVMTALSLLKRGGKDDF